MDSNFKDSRMNKNEQKQVYNCCWFISQPSKIYIYNIYNVYTNVYNLQLYYQVWGAEV